MKSNGKATHFYCVVWVVLEGKHQAFGDMTYYHTFAEAEKACKKLNASRATKNSLAKLRYEIQGRLFS